jgi:hypothetical protein
MRNILDRYADDPNITYKIAGVLVHEMLHTLGYKHDNLKVDAQGYTVEESITGNAVFETGYCLDNYNQLPQGQIKIISPLLRDIFLFSFFISRNLTILVSYLLIVAYEPKKVIYL